MNPRERRRSPHLKSQGELVLVTDVDQHAFLQDVASDKALKTVADEWRLCSQYVFDNNIRREVDIDMELVTRDRLDCGWRNDLHRPDGFEAELRRDVRTQDGRLSAGIDQSSDCDWRSGVCKLAKRFDERSGGSDSDLKRWAGRHEIGEREREGRQLHPDVERSEVQRHIHRRNLLHEERLVSKLSISRANGVDLAVKSVDELFIFDERELALCTSKQFRTMLLEVSELFFQQA